MSDITKLIEFTKDSNPSIRLNSLKQMCPCKVKNDIDLFWNRIFEMATDENDDIRYQVLHIICDGSPSHLEENVANALELFNHDKNKMIRRRAHKVMASYLRKGKWNIL
jgi:Ca2+-binding EF-hand superfamily protein